MWSLLLLDVAMSESGQLQEVFLFSKKSKPVLGSTQLPIVWGRFFRGVKRHVPLEADHSPSSSAEVKNEWIYTSAVPVYFHGVNSHNFTFTVKDG
jgi:hypothetical protein